MRRGPLESTGRCRGQLVRGPQWLPDRPVRCRGDHGYRQALRRGLAPAARPVDRVRQTTETTGRRNEAPSQQTPAPALEVEYARPHLVLARGMQARPFVGIVHPTHTSFQDRAWSHRGTFPSTHSHTSNLTTPAI